METVDEKIERFRNYNRTMVDAAVEESNLRYDGLPAKLILCSILDSLSVAAFPEEKSNNRVRFTKTIDKHSNWREHEKVSLLQIREKFSAMSNVPAVFEEFQSWLGEKCDEKYALTHSLIKNTNALNDDVSFTDVLLKWPKQDSGEPEKLDKKHLEQFTHRNLLWVYRNKLTHEFRLPGGGLQSSFGMEFDPYYQEVATITELNAQEGMNYTSHWELVYPTGFFKKIVVNCLESICTEYSEKQTSPFLEYQEGRLW